MTVYVAEGRLELPSIQPAGEPPQREAPRPSAERPRVRGKFLFAGDEKLYVRGITYGTFRPGANGSEFHDPRTVERDFTSMAATGLNAIRTYTQPPGWLLDLAHDHGLRVLVGLPWEQHVTFLDSARRAREIEDGVRAAVHACAGHPAVLGYTIGNEIPSSIVRWYGARPIERYLERLYRSAKAEDPESLVTYVNFPSTEYLDLGFLDVVSFNVYLEAQERLAAYLARLQNLAGDRPLLLAEIGLDSRRNGEDHQARTLDWQIRTAFASGCAGAFVFAWTDEWYRGGADIGDWDFGLTRRDRQPKPALYAVAQAFRDVPLPVEVTCPRISVVVCSYNGARTIGECLAAAHALDYPDYEVIVVDDGSTDRTRAIAHASGARVISTENRGLSSARNTGLEAATGEIVAYIDDDAYPDPHWLKYLAAAFGRGQHAGVGGPNLPPAGDGLVAECVASAPGGPVHVLVADELAEHIPGCNMAFRKAQLQAIGGFDPQFRAAGDDVDVCWRIQAKGWTIGFSPAAMVWHHRRNSVSAYWKQQRGYGRAEALLERKWPEKYNLAGHLTWAGRLYGPGLAHSLSLARGRIYHGAWGTGLFQSIYQPAPGLLQWLPLMPEWYLLIGFLLVLSLLGSVWTPLLVALPLFLLAAGGLGARAILGARRASTRWSQPRDGRHRFQRWALTVGLYLLQPLARLSGRLSSGLSPWRFGGVTPRIPRRGTASIWTQTWRGTEQWLRSLEASLRGCGSFVRRGGAYDRWDLEVSAGLLGGARALMAIEEHGAGQQLVRFRFWPRLSPAGPLLSCVFGLLAEEALDASQGVVGAVLAALAIVVAARTVLECSMAIGAIQVGVDAMRGERA